MVAILNMRCRPPPKRGNKSPHVSALISQRSAEFFTHKAPRLPGHKNRFSLAITEQKQREVMGFINARNL